MDLKIPAVIGLKVFFDWALVLMILLNSSKYTLYFSAKTDQAFIPLFGRRFQVFIEIISVHRMEKSIRIRFSKRWRNFRFRLR
jgi:hypothetical protein